MWSFLKTRRPKKAAVPVARKARLALENLEGRDVPSTLVILDFDGAIADELADARAHVGSGHWPDDVETAPDGRPMYSSGLTGLTTLGATDFPFLDVDYNGKIDLKDANYLANEVVRKLQLQYAGFDVRVVRADNHASAMQLLGSSSAHDTLIYVTGNPCIQPGGQAPTDVSNNSKDLAKVDSIPSCARYIKSGGHVDDRAATDWYTQLLADFAAHEAGHTFGLAHITDPNKTDPSTGKHPPLITGWNLMDASQTYISHDADPNQTNYRFAGPGQVLSTELGLQNQYDLLVKACGKSSSYPITVSSLPPRGSTVESVTVNGALFEFGVCTDGSFALRNPLSQGWKVVPGMPPSASLAVVADGTAIRVFGIGQDGSVWAKSFRVVSTTQGQALRGVYGQSDLVPIGLPTRAATVRAGVGVD